MRTTCLFLLAFWPMVVQAADKPGSRRSLTFEERVEAQRAIEEIYWQHRIWPKENPGPKPPLEAVLPEDGLRAKVEDYLKKSNALEVWWQRPITGEQLQAEMERITSSTKTPQVLRELFETLGDDPFVIAETLARQDLVDRLVRNWYAFDDRFHGETRRAAEAAIQESRKVESLSEVSGYEEVVYERGKFQPFGEPQVGLGEEEWEHLVEDLGQRFGIGRERPGADTRSLRRPSDLEESADSYSITVILEITMNRIRTGTVRWRKRSFETWWGETRRALGTSMEIPPSTYSLVHAPLGGCPEDTWRPISHPPDRRSTHTTVWTGTEMIVWGGQGPSGLLGSGGRYNPATDSWSSLSTGPEARRNHTAIWTGSEMIIWGGAASQGVLGSGSRYNPSTDSWTPILNGMTAPTARSFHTAIWTGTDMIIWGGGDGIAAVDTGGRYVPSTDTWTPTPIGAGTPSARYLHAAVWTGTEMIVWGGVGAGYLNTGGRYNPATDTWMSTGIGANLPSGRMLHTAVWTGSEMVIWGGYAGAMLDTGGRYDPAVNSWAPTSGSNAPAARHSHTAVWTGSEMIVGGGIGSASQALGTGARYNTSTDSWISTSTAPTPQYGHTAVWTGSEMIIWGGIDSAHTALDTGARYNTSTDSWIVTSTAPTPTWGHTAVWTGAEMIIWGGQANSGHRYDLSTNSWRPISTSIDAPGGKWGHSAIWTGTEVIIWGGEGATLVNTGGRYNPASDSWVPTAHVGDVPSARYLHTAIWTGTEMVVWGGSEAGIAWGGTGPSGAPTNTGGHYDPASDSWTPTSTGLNVSETRWGHAAVWTGTEMIVWGGIGIAGVVNSGARYVPSADAWTPVSLGAGVPSRRGYFTAVWAGSEMIVWGGVAADGTVLNTGGRYSPAADAWMPTPVGADAPTARGFHTLVWTESEMIVWGGWHQAAGYLFTGSRYDPLTDSWSVTATGTNAPGPRSDHTAVWTGLEMLVWGGFADGAGPGPGDDGRAYCASPCRLWYSDADGDGYGDPQAPARVCDGSELPRHVSNGRDCDDGSAAVGPHAIEVCNGIDDNCNGLVDEDEWGEDSDNDGIRNRCDNCRFQHNPSQFDSDADALGNSCDNCTFVGNPDQADFDSDGRGDFCDNCLADYNPFQDDYDTDGAGDTCDNCVFDHNPQQRDADDDFEGDLCDLDDGVILIRFFQPDYVEWQEEVRFDLWNSYRGDLAMLRATGVYTQAPGSNPLARQNCGLNDPWAEDFDSPEPGVTAIFLTTGVSGGVESSLGMNSAGAERPNDNPCP